VTTPPSGFDPQGQEPYGQQPPHGQQPPPGYGAPQQPYGVQQPYGAPGGYNQPPPPGGVGGGLDYIQLPGVGTVRLASMGQRFLARLLDGLIVGIPITIIFTVLSGVLFASAVNSTSTYDPETGTYTGGTVAAGAGLGIIGTVMLFPVLILVLEILYEVSMIATRGATFGKQIMGVKVIREHDGSLPGWGPAFGRFGLMFGPVIVPCIGPLFTLLCELSPFFDSLGRRQGWHDKAAKTIVVATK
jgi:uncharacterized RDD family membrane protein YckC